MLAQERIAQTLDNFKSEDFECIIQDWRKPLCLQLLLTCLNRQLDESNAFTLEISQARFSRLYAVHPAFFTFQRMCGSLRGVSLCDFPWGFPDAEPMRLLTAFRNKEMPCTIYSGSLMSGVYILRDFENPTFSLKSYLEIPQNRSFR